METIETDWAETEAENQEAVGLSGRPEETETIPQALTPKMLALMERMSEYGYLTMAEIQFVFGNKTWAYGIMKDLRGQGLVADFDTLLSPRTAHYLTARGYRVLGKFDKLKTGWRFRPERYSTFSFRHRMACAKVGLLLEKHPLVFDFLPEIRLWKYRTKATEKVCDGEFWYRVPGRELADRVGLEVELTLKNRDKLVESFEQLGRRELHQVWWVCGDKTIFKAMRREVLGRRWLAPQRHFFCLLEDFLAAKNKAELMEPGGALLSIDADKPTLLTRAPEPPRSEPEPIPPPKPAVAFAPTHYETQAAAVLKPKPAPLPKPNPLMRDITRLGSLASQALKWAWNWLRESWSVYKCYDDSWTLTFHRWPHVCAAGALVAALMICINGPALLKITRAIANPSEPPPRWRKREFSGYDIPNAGWWLQPLALSSANGHYRFKARLMNENSWETGLCGAAIFDTENRMLSSHSFKRVNIKRGYQLVPDLSFDFRSSRPMDRFLVILLAGPYSCDKTWQRESFVVQFH